MISNLEISNEIRQQWKSLRELEQRFSGDCVILPDQGAFNIPDSPPESYNLILVLAFSVLDIFLSQCVEENLFSCEPRNNRKILLGRKLNASKEVINWIDYDIIHEAKEARNSLAHESSLVGKEDCIRYVLAIEKELLSFGVLKNT